MASYYTARDGKQAGPFEEAEVLRQLEERTLSPHDLCWRDGMADWLPIANVMNVPSHGSSPASSATPAPRFIASPLFLHIPVSRLILMSIVSFSLYEAYWIYKNWRYVRERDRLDIRPFWRAFFAVFFCHSLLRRIHEDKEARAHVVPTFSPQQLATGWVALIILAYAIGRWPGIAATIVSAFIPSFLCLVPVQSYINAVSERRSPGQPYHRWSSGHVVCLVVGIAIWALVLVAP